MAALARWAYYASSLPTIVGGVRNWPRALAALLGGHPSRPFEIRLRDGCRFRVATALDVWVVKEVCLDREYERGGLGVPSGGTIVDIGAGVGEFCVSVARQRPDCTVYAFEPLPESIALLRDNVRVNGLRNLSVIAGAVGARSGETALRADRAAPARSSTTSTASRDAAASIRVRSLTLDEAFRDLGLRRCDFLKIDCEGAEYEILFGAAPETLARVARIALEYHEGVTAFSGAELAGFLRAAGFSVTLTPNRAYPERLGLLHASRSPAR